MWSRLRYHLCAHTFHVLNDWTHRPCGSCGPSSRAEQLSQEFTFLPLLKPCGRFVLAPKQALAGLHGLAAPTQGSLIIRCLSADIRLARTVPPSQRVEEIQDGSAEAHRVLL